jgi:hypothetical protein
MSDFELIEDAAVRAAKELLAGWPTDEVPIKWKNELDWKSGSARCRQKGGTWIEVENIQATATQAAIYASKQSAKGFIRFAINVQLGTGDSVLNALMVDLNKRFVGKAIGNIYFLTSIPRPSEREAEYLVKNFDVNYEYI